MTRWTQVLAAGMAAASMAAGLARAQTVPEGQSCGGLLCDMGVFGHKTAPAAAAPPPAAPAQTPAPRPTAEAAPAAVPPAAKPRARKHLAVAHPAHRPTITSRSVPSAAALPAPIAAARAPIAAAVRAPLAARPAIALPTAPSVAVEMPAPRRPVIIFQSIDPSLQ